MKKYDYFENMCYTGVKKNYKQYTGSKVLDVRRYYFKRFLG